ncbi:MAG: PA0069 family radical SAM protein [Nitrospinota bacterium]
MLGGCTPIRGRGAAENPQNRFESLRYDWDLDPAEPLDPEDPAPATRFLKDPSRSIIAYNQSPDVGFDASLNPYRGCEHGCIYCYARPAHEYLGFSAGLDFETKILVKEDAPALLRKALSSPLWKPQAVALSGVTDPYQPAERRLALTRKCLEVLAEFRNPVVVITKNHLVTRDIDLLGHLAECEAVAVFLSVTTLNENLRRLMEPRASPPLRRLAAIEALVRAGAPAGVLVAPVIPALTDHELPSILQAAAGAGAQFAGYVPLRLPHGVSRLFEQWLDRHFPAKKDKVLNRIRAIRGGRLNDPRFSHRMRGEGVFAEQIENLFSVACRKAGILGRRPGLSTGSFRRPLDSQLALFEPSG